MEANYICRNPYFIGINSAIIDFPPILLIPTHVAILILLELTLQCKANGTFSLPQTGRNPYFIGINSAIVQNFDYFQCFDI